MAVVYVQPLMKTWLVPAEQATEPGESFAWLFFYFFHEKINSDHQILR